MSGQGGGYNNVYFIGVARVQGVGIIVASFSHNTETDLGGVKTMLEQPTLSMQVGKHYSFQSGNAHYNLIQGSKNTKRQ